MKKHRIIVFLVLVFSTVEGLFAQNTDTMYVVKRHVVRDTVYVRDTLRVQDTIIVADYIHSEEFKRLFYELSGADGQTPSDSLEKLWAQTVTFLENRVIQYEQQNVSTMDSIKKYGLAGLMLLGLNSLAPAQTETTQPAGSPHIKTESVLRDSPFNGFHFGYTAEADIVHPVEMTSYATAKTSFSSVRYGGRVGLEFSYHFADYFGVSSALDFGYIGSDKSGIFYPYYGVSMPLKFEFHYPVADKLWVTANAGVQLRMPWETFLYGYNPNEGQFTANLWYIGNPVYYTGYCPNRHVFYADLMADVGLYYQLPNQDYLRFLAGLNIATTDWARGGVELYSMGYEELYAFQRNHYLYFQIAYLHGFSKQRAIKQAQPHWNDDKSFYRHEFRLGVSDHFGFLGRWAHQYTTFFDYGGERVGTTSTDYHFTPVVSLDYHYRAAKWFWIGLSTGYSFMKEKLYPGNVVSPDGFHWDCKEHHFLIMPSLRFSYLNRPHVTLYSGLAVGVLINRGNRYYGDLSTLPEFAPATWGLVPAELPDHTSAGSAFQLTAFGVKAGAKHWFGSFEAGVGIKGFVNLGVGYEF